MILKWKEKSGAWRLTDGITNVTNHGWVELVDAQKLADDYDGVDTPLYFPMGASFDKDFKQREVIPRKKDTDPRVGQYIIFTIHGKREHWFMTTIVAGYLLSA